MRAKLTAGLDAVRAALADMRARSPRTLVLLVTCLLIVALGPPVLTLARAKEYEATFSIAQAAPLPLSQASQGEQVAGIQLVMGAIITPAGLARDVLAQVDFPDRPKQVSEQITIRGRWRDGRPEAVVTTLAPTSDQARGAGRGRGRRASPASGARRPAWDPP